MKNKFLTGLVTLGVAVFLLSSCEEVPQVEIDAATAAVEDAKASEADVYVPSSYVALSDSLKSVKAEIEAENSNFFKSFKAAKVKLANVTVQAATVKADAIARKEAVKAEVEGLLAEVDTLIQTGKQLAEAAPKGKEGAEALQAIKDELAAVEAAAAEAATQASAGQLLGALDKIKAAKEKATSINTELQTVIDKYKSARKR